MAQQMFAISATVTRVLPGEDGTAWTTTRQVPTFYMHPNVQGLLTEERAAEVARKVINVFDEDLEVHVTAEEVRV